MKKLIVASAIAMTMTAGSAMASSGDIQFFGNVTAATCDVTPEVNGNVSNLIQLGTVEKNSKGGDVDLIFKATDNNGGDCADMTGKTASIAWSGNLTTDGIGAQTGLATDAYVVLTPDNGIDSEAITSSDNVSEFNADEVTKDGLKFKAYLQGGNKVGDFHTAVAYAVTYK